jgi:hypothetical protein
VATRHDDDAATGERGLVKNPAGKVEIDSRGRSVWRWACEVLESTSVLLKRLENRDLALEPTQKVPIQRSPAGRLPGAKAQGRSAPKLSLTDERGRDDGGGFDPYNSR